MSTYPFVQGLDYGPRKGTLGIGFHMSEGGDGLVGFLERHAGETLARWRERVNGVSCSVAILSTGKVVQMVDFDNAHGNLNPADRAAEYGYYGHHHLADVLGDHWPDPNTWSLSAELAGYRDKGPTDAQVVAAIAWGKRMIARFPTIRGTYGHHDQSPKGCPGTTANMKAIFDGLGGHGLWTHQEADVYTETTIVPGGGTFVIPPATKVAGFQIDATGAIVAGPSFGPAATSSSAHYDATVTTNATRGGPFLRVLDGTLARFLIAEASVTVKPAPSIAQLVIDAKAAEHERTRALAIAAVEAL